MQQRLNNLLIGKIRHNLKTYLNITCGFAELLSEELLDEERYEKDSALGPRLFEISENGTAIVQQIDQMLSSQNFTLNQFFLQLSDQSDSLWKKTEPHFNQINEQLSDLRRICKTTFVQDFSSDLKKIENASNDLKSAIKKLIHENIDDVDQLVTLEILSKDDLKTVLSFSDALREAPNVLDTKYPSKILIIDDNPSNTEYLKRKLEAAQHNAVLAHSGIDAEQVISSEPDIDLILLDLLMPEMNGYDFLGRNRDILKSRNIPVIVVSSLDEQETVYRCMEAGAEDYVTKPINFMILSARINSALERKNLQDREVKHLAKIEEEKQKNEELLLNILPKSIATRMKNEELTIADSFDMCTMLFGDIVGFTPLSQELSEGVIVQNLNRIFSAFDRFCEELKVEKIKTMGDAYMVASGIPEPDPNHADKIADLGFKMLAYMSTFPEIEGHKVSMRIGIHSGPAVAGVIGKNKFVYDLWGDAVNTACRMESYGVPDAIHISSATADLLTTDRFTLTPREPMEIKGKGIMQTYILTAMG